MASTGVRLALASVLVALPPAMVGVSAGAVPRPSVDAPVWYGLVALVWGYWLAAVRWARERETG